jgi:hypothetical protein
MQGIQMIFIPITNEEKVQVDDKTRIDATSTYTTPDEADITLVEIEPEAGAGFIDVTSSSKLDWSYVTEGEKTISVRVTTDGLPTVKTSTILVISVTEDKLFSNDKQIISLEVDLYRFLRPGRATFLDFHRLAQKKIMDDLDQRGLVNRVGAKLTKEDIYDVEEISDWSKYLALSLIFKSVQSEVDDVYAEKSREARQEADRQSTRASIRLDLNRDQVADSRPDLNSGRLVRR